MLGPDMTMFEIQDAAKLITEAIDSDAKVIFGAIYDDKLKKNEIKVTVIASGFPENNTRKVPGSFLTDLRFGSKNTEENKTSDKEKETTREETEEAKPETPVKPSLRNIFEKPKTTQPEEKKKMIPMTWLVFNPACVAQRNSPLFTFCFSLYTVLCLT